MSNLRRRLKKVEEKLNIDINKSKHLGAFTRACAREGNAE
jgi:DNA-binding PucR family transcriptional regulator